MNIVQSWDRFPETVYSDLIQAQSEIYPLEISESDPISTIELKANNTFTSCKPLFKSSSKLLDSYIEGSNGHDYTIISEAYTKSREILHAVIEAFGALSVSLKKVKEASSTYNARHEIGSLIDKLQSTTYQLTAYNQILEAKMGQAFLISLKNAGHRIANEAIPSVFNKKFTSVKKSLLSHQQLAEEYLISEEEKSSASSMRYISSWRKDFLKSPDEMFHIIASAKKEVDDLMQAEAKHLKVLYLTPHRFNQSVTVLKADRNDCLREMKNKLPQVIVQEEDSTHFVGLFGELIENERTTTPSVTIESANNLETSFPPLVEMFFDRTLTILDHYLYQLSTASSRRECQAIAFEIEDALQIANSVYESLSTMNALLKKHNIAALHSRDILAISQAKACAILILCRTKSAEAHQIYASAYSKFIDQDPDSESFSQQSPLYVQRQLNAGKSSLKLQSLETTKSPIVSERLDLGSPSTDPRILSLRERALDILERFEDPEITKDAYRDLIQKNLLEAEALKQEALNLQRLVVRETSVTALIPKAQKSLQDLRPLVQELNSCLPASYQKKSPAWAELDGFIDAKKAVLHAFQNLLKEANLVLDTCLENIENATNQSLATKTEKESQEVHKLVKPFLATVENWMNRVTLFIEKNYHNQLKELYHERTQMTIYEALLKIKRAQVFLKYNLLNSSLGSKHPQMRIFLESLLRLEEKAVEVQKDPTTENASDLAAAQTILKSVEAIKKQVHALLRF
jgi:hypothetical protein